MEEREAKVKKHFLLTEIVITYHGKVKFLVHMCVYTSTRLLIIGNRLTLTDYFMHALNFQIPTWLHLCCP